MDKKARLILDALGVGLIARAVSKQKKFHVGPTKMGVETEEDVETFNKLLKEHEARS